MNLFKSFLKELSNEYSNVINDLKLNLSWVFNRVFTSQTLTIALTKKCNLNCVYCWDYNHRDELPELSANEIKILMKNAIDLGIKNINPFGGEPFIRKDIYEILEYGFQLDATITLTTNGTLISHEQCIRLVNTITPQSSFTLLVSLDGVSKKENDYIRLAGSYSKTIGFIKTLVDERIRQKKRFSININNVVSRNNFKSMIKMIELCKELGVEQVHFLTPTVSEHSPMHQRTMVEKDLIILPEDFHDLDRIIENVIQINRREHLVVNNEDSLVQFKKFYRNQYEQHKPYIDRYRNAVQKN